MDGGAAFHLDEAKSEACLAQRDFGFASGLSEGPVLEQPDNRRAYGETRMQTIGRIDGELFVVAYTQRGRARHIISARCAHQKEFRNGQSDQDSRSGTGGSQSGLGQSLGQS